MGSIPLVSIIIPTFNRAHLIGETLDSVLAQTYTNWECIVVDDGSSDTTKELLEEYCSKDPRFQYHQRPNDRPKGANACRNFGFELSKGEYVNFFDSDDLMHAEFLNNAIKLASLKKAGMVINNLAFFKETKENISFKIINKSNNANLIGDYITAKINLNTPSIIWSKSIIKNFKFDEKLFRAQELDFNFRVLKSTKINASFSDEVYVYIRISDDSITNNYSNNNYKSVTSEIKVRRNILAYILDKKLPRTVYEKALKIYLKGLYKLYTFYKISFIFELFKLTRLLDRKKYIILFFKIMTHIFLRRLNRKQIEIYKVIERNE